MRSTIDEFVEFTLRKGEMVGGPLTCDIGGCESDSGESGLYLYFDIFEEDGEVRVEINTLCMRHQRVVYGRVKDEQLRAEAQGEGEERGAE